MKNECAEVVLCPAVYCGSYKRHKFEIVYDSVAPNFGGLLWAVDFCGSSHYFETLYGTLCYCAGRNFFGYHDIPRIRSEIVENTIAAMTEAGEVTGIAPPRAEDIM